MQSQYQFIPFENVTRGKMLREAITLTKTKVFVLSKEFVQKNNINPEKNQYAFYYHDSKENAVAIHFIANKMEGAFKVTYDPRGNGAAIACGNFLKAFKIDSNKYIGRYPVKKHYIEGKGEAFVIDLSERE